MRKDDLLKNEQIERILSPHPLSFGKLQVLCIFVIIWGSVIFGWLLNFSEYKETWFANHWIAILVWGFGLLLVGVIASLVAIQWGIFALYLLTFASGMVLIIWQGWLENVAIVIPFFSLSVAIAGFLIVELYRRSHKYIITNLRIIFEGGFLTKRKRKIGYDKIIDTEEKQGILGQIFGFGTIIPITQSGTDIDGEKSTPASGREKVKTRGLFGSKDAQAPLARSYYYELHGVYPFKDVVKKIDSFKQEHVSTPYQKEQVEYQKKQVDLQQQMRDLLKKQTAIKEDIKAVKEQEPEEEEEAEEQPEKKNEQEK